MDIYTTQSSLNSSSPSNRPPLLNSTAGSYNQGCAPHLHKDMLQPQARNHHSPHSSYPSPGSKVELAPSCQAAEPHVLHNQRSPLSGGHGGSRTPTRGDQDRHLKAQSSPANASATSNKNSSSVPYSHFQPHPGLGHQGAPPPPPLPPTSSTSVPQQQQSGAHEAWRYQSRPSSHSLVSKIHFTTRFFRAVC